jgi:hypothetical protein
MLTSRWSLALAALMLIAAATPAHAGRTISLRFPPFEVPPKSDLELCTFVPMPMKKPFEIVGSRIQNVGVRPDFVSHHFLMWTYDGKDVEKFPAKGQLVASKACLDFGPTDTNQRSLIGGSQQPLLVTRLPQGLAQEVKPTVTSNGESQLAIILNSHWINSADRPQKASVRVKLFGAKRHTVRQKLLPIFDVFANAGLFVPPGQTATTGGNWPRTATLTAGFGGGSAPKGPACVVLLTSHMHKRGTLFTIDHVIGPGSKERVLETQLYSDPPQAKFTPPMLVQRGEGLPYACTHDNGVTTPVKLGCEEQGGATSQKNGKPGVSVVDALFKGLTADGALSGAAKRCSALGPDPGECPPTDPAYPNRAFTGNCVEANLVFGFTSDDDMCIMPGSYYPANAQGSCDLSGLPILN